MFFLLVSCCLWLLQTLNDDYETDIAFGISVQGLPKSIELVDPDGIDVEVRLHDRGTVLAGYKMQSEEPIPVDFSNFKYSNGVLALPVSVLKNQVQTRLQSTTSIVRFVYDTLYLNVRQNQKLVPVHVNGRIDAADHYEIQGIEVVPSSVMVSATPDALEKMEFLNTEFIVKRFMKADKVLTAKVVSEGTMGVEPSEVKVHIRVAPLKVKKAYVPVTKVNFPAYYHALWLPTEVEVAFEVPEAYYELLGPSDFAVQIDYNDIVNAHGKPVELKLVTSPSQAKNIVLTPNEIKTIAL